MRRIKACIVAKDFLRLFVHINCLLFEFFLKKIMKKKAMYCMDYSTFEWLNSLQFITSAYQTFYGSDSGWFING